MSDKATGTTDPAASEHGLGEREPGYWGPRCKRCGGAPLGVHCPGCGTCWPNESCAIMCDAAADQPEWFTKAMQLNEEWHEAHGYG